MKAQILPMYIYPHPMLREVATPVTTFDANLRQDIINMKATLQEAKGIGLAATQVGIKKRIFIANCDMEGEAGKRTLKEGADFIAFINPKLIKHSEKMPESEEGCLSIPHMFTILKNKRYQTVTISYQDEHGKEQTFTGSDLWAACIQHEMDHLDGILFPDHLSRLKREMFYKKFEKLLPAILREVTYEVITAE